MDNRMTVEQVGGWVSWYLSAYVDSGVFGRNDSNGDLPAQATQASTFGTTGSTLVFSNGQKFRVTVEEVQ